MCASDRLHALTQFACRPSLLVSMAELIPDDIYEKIFLTLSLRELITCKSVCKLWKSFISGSRFVKAHLSRSYNRNENGHKRIGEAVFLIEYFYGGHTLIGYSNGLICIYYGHDRYNGDKILVGNPSTREGRMVPRYESHLTPNYLISCWGFGYDSLTDDYKVVQGVKISKGMISFQVFSLKLNAWNVIGVANYTGSKAQRGLFCNGAIHWVMHPKKNQQKQVILSFDLSKEEFKEISQPNYGVYKSDMSLGILEECLCIRGHHLCSRRHHWRSCECQTKEWVMKKYNDKQSWVSLPDDCQMKFECADNILKVRARDARLDARYWFIGNQMFEGGPTIVESLVSPHLKAENV